MFRINIFLFFVAGVTILGGCKDDIGGADTKQKFVISDSLLKTIQIDSVEMRPVVSSLTLTGQITFNEERVARILPLVSGIISGINVQLGDYVQKGQSLGIINSGEMAGYANDLVNAQTNLLIAKKNLDASEDMYKSGLVSEKDMLATREMYNQAQAQLTRANEILRINGGNTTGKYVLKAPVGGFIVERLVNNDMAIRPDNAGNLFTISDLKDVWVLANVYESNIGNIHLGDIVEITTLSHPGRIFHGRVDKLFNVLDPTNKVMKVRIVLQKPDYALKPQMFASVKVISKTNQESLCVPSGAVIFKIVNILSWFTKVLQMW